MPIVTEPNPNTTSNNIAQLFYRIDRPLPVLERQVFWGRYIQHASSPNVLKLLIFNAWSPPQISEQPKNILSSVDNLSNESKKLLGPNCCKRFEEFKNYDMGWDENGLPLSLSSVATMEYLITFISYFYIEPSLFLTKNGNLQLEWENSEGKHIELEFFHNKIEFYIEATDSEGQASLDEDSLNLFLDILKKHNYLE